MNGTLQPLRRLVNFHLDRERVSAPIIFVAGRQQFTSHGEQKWMTLQHQAISVCVSVKLM
jgi:hypothetical protein